MNRNTLNNQQDFAAAQKLAFEAVREVAKLVREGWTEIQAASLLDTYLKDHGVHSLFHHGFAWFGERSGFEDMKTYKDFMPTQRVLLPGDAFILDVAPIFKGCVADVGYSGCLGEHPHLKEALLFLKMLRDEIPSLFQKGLSGGLVWKYIDKKIVEAGYTNAYTKYPLSVLGHKVHRVAEAGAFLKLMRFGWQSFWSIASRGVFSELIKENSKKLSEGLWAIEPHLSGKTFGAKFEEILVVTATDSYWLEKDALWL